MKRRVVITACSAITPIGHGKDEIIRHLVEGVSGVKKLKTDDLLSKYIQSGVFGTVDYTIDYDFKRQHRKTMGPVSYYACQVAKEVLENSGLSNEFITSGKLGVAFGSTHGSPTVQREIYKSFFSESPSSFSSIGAADYLKSMVHTTAVNITKMFGHPPPAPPAVSPSASVMRWSNTACRMPCFAEAPTSMTPPRWLCLTICWPAPPNLMRPPI